MSDGGGILLGLTELARQVRGHTLKMLDLPKRSWLTWSPPGTSNHILWHAGHAVWLQDVLSVKPLTGRSELPHGWSGTFGQNSRPATIADWPPASEVVRQLEAQLQRLLELYAEHAERITRSGREGPAGGGWPLVAGIIHGWHDEARHQGEMYLLYKLHRVRQK